MAFKRRSNGTSSFNYDFFPFLLEQQLGRSGKGKGREGKGRACEEKILDSSEGAQAQASMVEENKKKKIIDELLKDAPPGQVKQVLSGKTHRKRKRKRKRRTGVGTHTDCFALLSSFDLSMYVCMCVCVGNLLVFYSMFARLLQM